MGEMFARMLQKMEGMENKMEGMNNKIDGNTKRMENKMDGNTKKMEEMRGETQNMGVSLKGSLDKLKEEMKEEVGTIRAEVTGMKDKVKDVGIAMEESKKEMTKEIKTTATVERQRPGRGCSFIGDRAGFARQRAGGPCRATHEAPHARLRE